eukprot:GFYU01033162.1.p1 GENE.GFYU01033162.1~~GFYU01033162.1.p1  ORF type:complete len:202 (+),score=33.50 GFYU01033162.1:67-672(+)
MTGTSYRPIAVSQITTETDFSTHKLEGVVLSVFQFQERENEPAEFGILVDGNDVPVRGKRGAEAIEDDLPNQIIVRFYGRWAQATRWIRRGDEIVLSDVDVQRCSDARSDRHPCQLVAEESISFPNLQIDSSNVPSPTILNPDTLTNFVNTTATSYCTQVASKKNMYSYSEVNNLGTGLTGNVFGVVSEIGAPKQTRGTGE